MATYNYTTLRTAIRDARSAGRSVAHLQHAERWRKAKAAELAEQLGTPVGLMAGTTLATAALHLAAVHELVDLALTGDRKKLLADADVRVRGCRQALGTAKTLMTIARKAQAAVSESKNRNR